jgi:hypothetical protein
MRLLGSFLAGIGLMALIAGVHGVKLAGETIAAARRLLTETSEQRRLDAYGDCSARAYGYVTRVLANFPEPDAAPLVRYHGYDRFGALVLPFERKRVDDRVLVGVNLRDEDLSEQVLACRRSTEDGEGAWFVRADQDVDTLTGFQVDVGSSPTPRPAQLDITLYDTPQRRHDAGRWTFPVAAGTAGTITVRPDRPLKPFSVHNRSVGFLFDVKGFQLARFDLLILSVDARGYVRVHARGGCSTSIRADLLSDARGRRGPWREWLDSLPSQ